MKLTEFNKKYSAYLEPKFYGLTIDVPDVIDYLDREFALEIERNPNFEYSQIKMKFAYPCVYTNSKINNIWSAHIKDILDQGIMTDIIY